MDKMLGIGILISAKDMASGVLRQFGSTSQETGGKATSAFQRVGEAISQVSSKLTVAGVGLKLFGSAVQDFAAKPVMAYARLDDAVTNLQVAMMDRTGKIGAEFAEIKKQAIDLGNVLPGTTADFANVATALLEQGTALDVVMKGGLKAASHLAVVLKLPPAEAGTMVAKLREAYGLADNELEKMADLTQRAKFAFGMTPDELKSAAAYSGATQNILGLTGLENAKKLLALQGLGAGVSLEGSSWGTNFAMLLTRTAESKDRLAKNSKEMKAINEDLRQYGITLDFFDDKGNFKGVDNLVKQLEKAQVMTQADRLNLFKKLFGVEAGRPAMIIAEKGFKGYQDAIEKLDKQASLQQRIERITQSTKNVWDALTGSIENVMALLAEPAVEWLKPVIGDLNTVVGKVGDWVAGNKETVKWIGLAVAGVGALAAVAGTVSLTIGILGKAFAWVPKLAGLFGKKGGILGGAASAAGAAGGAGLPVFVTNWPGSGMPGLPSLPDKPGGILGPDGKPIAKGPASTPGGAKPQGRMAQIGSTIKDLAQSGMTRAQAAGGWIMGGARAALAAPTLGALASGGTAGLAAAGGMVAGAGAAGYGVGTLINKTLIEGTPLGDSIGRGIAKTLAVFGHQGAQDALRAEEASRQAMRPKTPALTPPAPILPKMAAPVPPAAPLFGKPVPLRMEDAARPPLPKLPPPAPAPATKNAAQPVTIHQQFTFHIQGGEEGIQKKIEQAVKMSQVEFKRMMERYLHDKQRTGYGNA